MGLILDSTKERDDPDPVRRTGRVKERRRAGPVVRRKSRKKSEAMMSIGKRIQEDHDLVLSG